MNKYFLHICCLSIVTLLLQGCSLFSSDHSNDYKEVRPVDHKLKVPLGSLPSKDVLIIPNEDQIKHIDSSESFEAPRAPFIFYPMVAIGYSELEDRVEFTVPTSKQASKTVVTDFLSALHGAGLAVDSQTNDQITSIAFEFNKEGWLRSLWSSITRLYPAKTRFMFEFTEQDGNTLVSIQYRNEKKGEELAAWQSPVGDAKAYSISTRLWGTFGRQLKQSTAYLSTNDQSSIFPIWVNHQGIYSIYLGKDISEQQVEKTLNAAGIHIISKEDNLLAPVPEEDVARVGDIIGFMIPTANGGTQKLFNVRRRNLDDVTWEQREYRYEITKQNVGEFLFIDVSSVEHPEVASFHFVQRILNK